MERLAEKKTGIILKLPLGLEIGDLADEDLRVKHHAVTDNAPLPSVKNAGGDQVEHDLLVAHHKGVTGVVPPLIADHIIGKLGIDIDYFSFTFIAPLGADHHYVCHPDLLVSSYICKLLLFS